MKARKSWQKSSIARRIRLNLEACGVDYDAGSGIHVNDFLRTSNPHIYAAGDVCLEHRYGHTAAASARTVRSFSPRLHGVIVL